MDDDWYDIITDDIDDNIVIEPGKEYITYQTSKATVVYYIDKPDFYFFGHVYQDIDNGVIPIAVQWNKEGKVDPDLYDTGYDIVGYWKEPKRYIRYVYIYQDVDDITKTIVTEKPTDIGRPLIASKKVTLKKNYIL